MPQPPPTTGTGSTPDTPTPEGVISGYLLRLIRERLHHTQDQLAEALNVDPNTVKSWETGRRPLTNTKVGVLRTLRRRLQQLGADPHLLDHLDTAIDADLFIAHVLTPTTNPADHILATWVSTRSWNDILAWTLAGTPPTSLGALDTVRRGPAPTRPALTIPTQRRFFDQLRQVAEHANNGDPGAVLLRRQIYFMAGWDRSPDGRTWLADQERRELHRLRRGDGWTPDWVAGRSLAVARACQGDREQLHHFIAHQLADTDICEAANLNYWAYWIGEQPTAATSDDFMAQDLGAWRGTALLRHLTAGLDPTTPYLDLSVHTVWALLARRPHLLDDDAALTAELHRRTERLLAEPTDLSPLARRELDQLHFLTRTRGIRCIR